MRWPPAALLLDTVAQLPRTVPKSVEYNTMSLAAWTRTTRAPTIRTNPATTQIHRLVITPPARTRSDRMPADGRTVAGYAPERTVEGNHSAQNKAEPRPPSARQTPESRGVKNRLV